MTEISDYADSDGVLDNGVVSDIAERATRLARLVPVDAATLNGHSLNGGQGGSGGSDGPGDGSGGTGPGDHGESIPNRDNFGSPSTPRAAARAVLRSVYYTDCGDSVVCGSRRLVRWNGEWHLYNGRSWDEVSKEKIRAGVYSCLDDATYQRAITRRGVVRFQSVPWNPNKTRVNDVVDSMSAYCYLPESMSQPSWIREGVSAQGWVSMANCLLNVQTEETRDHESDLFTSYAIPFDYDPDAQCPRWLGFLESIWPDDKESKALLQEWFGYVLTGRTDLQKFMLIKGASRGGKGVIGRVLGKLLGGTTNVTGPTFSDFQERFGLSSSIGKPLAIIGDARNHGKIDMNGAVLQKILSIVGEDVITIDRKHKDAWSGIMSTRIMMMTNVMPSFRDSSSALLNRLLLLVTTESFAGREDLSLEPDLEKELPGICVWAMEGIRNLKANQWRFTVPVASAAVLQELGDQLNPVGLFIHECLDQGDDLRVTTDFLYAQYVAWCGEVGVGPLSHHGFGAKLKEQLPRVKDGRMPTQAGPDSRKRCYTGISLRTMN